MDPRFVESGASYYCSPVAGELTKVVKTSPGKLFYLRAGNTTGATRWLFVFDAAAAAGDLVMPPVRIPAGSDVELQFPYAIPFSTALTLSMSQTQAAYAAGGANDGQFHALFK